MSAERGFNHALGWTIIALLVTYAPQVVSKPLWITGLIIGCALARWLTAVRGGRLLPGWIRTPIGIICFLAVLGAYGGVNGVSPGSALLSVMGALKLLETRNRRDQFVVLFICLFLMLATFLVEQYLWSMAYLFVGFGVTLTAWMAVGRQAHRRPNKWYLRQALNSLGYSLPLLLVMWILFPRVPGPFWAIPTDSARSQTGLSSSLSPGDISTLSESQAVAFRVKFEGLRPAQADLYWRAIVMHRFDGRTWSADEPVYSRHGPTVESRGESTTYTITMEATRQRWLYALDMPANWEGAKIYRSGYFTLERVKPVNERMVYRVRSLLQYNAAPTMSSATRQYYTRLPASGNQRAQAFARDEYARAGSPAAFADRLLSYFRQEPFYYTLSPPTLGRDSVDEFLFTTRRGFCEHYASAFTYLMRAAGVPARVVAGYQGGTQNPFGEYLTVRQSDAHAWSEIWLAGRGWVRVDPTGAVAPQRIEENLDSALRQFGERQPGNFDVLAIERLRLTWDMINARYNEWVLGFGPETQRDFMAWLGLDDPDWRELTSLLAICLVGIMLTIAGWLAWSHRPPSGDSAARLYRQLQRKLGLPAARGETPSAWAVRATAVFPAEEADINNGIQRYLALRYGGDKSQRRNLKEAVRRVSWQVGRRRARRRVPAQAHRR